MHGELRAIETQLQGSGPWDFSGQALQDSAGDSSSGGPEQERELVIVHTPGHTRGHTCLYYAPSKVLFAGGLAFAVHSKVPGTGGGWLQVGFGNFTRLAACLRPGRLGIRLAMLTDVGCVDEAMPRKERVPAAAGTV